MIIRRAAAAAFGLVALAGGVMLLGYPASIAHTVSNGREIERQFRRGGAAIAQFETVEQRLPAPGEANALLAAAARGRYNVEWMASPSNCDAASPAYGALQRSPYVLTTWRGEWMECYSPTLGVTTVLTSPADYALLGAVAYDEWAIGALALLCLGSAVWLWRRAD